MSYPGDTEFGFELRVCRWAERYWSPADATGDAASGVETADTDSCDGGTAVVVARQLGTRARRWDTVIVETTPEQLAARARFGDRELDSDLLHVVRHAPAEWAWYRDALPDPGYPWRYVRAAVHRAAGRDLIEKRRNGNRIEIRRVAPYPDWVDRIVAVENKPNLDASAARALADQLSHDVQTALADEVWVATSATGATVEPALLEDVPVEVGVLAMDFGGALGDERKSADDRLAAFADSANVEWFPSALDSTAPAPQMDAEEKAERRRVIAERAFGRGWRSYTETMRHDCRYFELRRAGTALVPWCAAKECHQTAAECSGSCSAFEPEPPAWRTRGWPIEGGPGKGIERLLRRRRERVQARERGDDEAGVGSTADSTGGAGSPAGSAGGVENVEGSESDGIGD